jgi:hypothetical protein
MSLEQLPLKGYFKNSQIQYQLNIQFLVCALLLIQLNRAQMPTILEFQSL